LSNWKIERSKYFKSEKQKTGKSELEGYASELAFLNASFQAPNRSQTNNSTYSYTNYCHQKSVLDSFQKPSQSLSTKRNPLKKTTKHIRQNKSIKRGHDKDGQYLIEEKGALIYHTSVVCARLRRANYHCFKECGDYLWQYTIAESK
jgi:hypothetical protein